MPTCPHCGQPVRDEYTHCPFCGTDVATGERYEIDAEQNRKNAVGSGAALGCGLTAVAYFFFGVGWSVSKLMLSANWKPTPAQQASWTFSVTHGIWIGFGLPIIVTGVLYLALRRGYPVFARGLGYSCLVAVVLALGAPFWCNTSGPG